MEHKNTFIILLAGDLVADDRVKARCQSARIIAADGGIVHAKSLGVSPELLLGDFDSTPPDLIERYKHVEKVTFERAKDMSDGSLAIRTAVDMGAQSIVLVGALGGSRTDHTFALMAEMLQVYAEGIDISMTSGTEECWPLDDKLFEIDLPLGSMFSILPFSDLNGLSISGAQYPLDAVNVAFGSTHTISNIANGRVQITLQSGRAVLISRPHDFSGA